MFLVSIDRLKRINDEILRKEIGNAGDILISSKTAEIVSLATQKINNWRSLHLIPLDELLSQINKMMAVLDINPILVSRRLKRLVSIL